MGPNATRTYPRQQRNYDGTLGQAVSFDTIVGVATCLWRTAGLSPYHHTVRSSRKSVTGHFHSRQSLLDVLRGNFHHPSHAPTRDALEMQTCINSRETGN